MGALQHVYLTAHGAYTSGPFSGEIAQIGIRCPYSYRVPGPDKGGVFTPLVNGDIVSVSGLQSGTHGQLTKTWTARLGAMPSTDNLDGDKQIAFAEAFWTFLNWAKGVQNPAFRWTHVKVAPITPGGEYGAPSAVYQFTAPLIGTGTQAQASPEQAIAISLRAPIIGRRGRGRLYLPALSVGSTTAQDGTISGSLLTSLCDKVKLLVDTLQAVGSPLDAQPIVAVGSVGRETWVRPAEVRTGNLYDVQRRRGNSIRETYTALSL